MSHHKDIRTSENVGSHYILITKQYASQSQGGIYGLS